MSDNAKLVTDSGSTVTPQDDALVYETAIAQSGIIYGAEITQKSVNTLHINAGHGIICGRKITIIDGDIQIQLTTGATCLGRLYLHLDLSNTTGKLQILTETGAELSEPIQQSNININNGIYELNLATFDIDAQTISNVVNVFPVIKNKVGDLNNLTTENKDNLVAAINELAAKKIDVLDTKEEIKANTDPGKVAGAVGVKELVAEVNQSLQNINNNDYDYANPQEISSSGFTATADGYLVAYTNLTQESYLAININGITVASVVQTSGSYGGTCSAHVRKGNVITFEHYNSGFRRAVFYPRLAQ